MLKKNPRLLGLILLLIAGVLGYFFAYGPVQSAKAGEASVSLSMKILAFIPLFILVGAIFAIGGEAGQASIQATTPEGKPRLKPLGWVVVVLSIAGGIGLYFWIKSILEGYGYQF